MHNNKTQTAKSQFITSNTLFNNILLTRIGNDCKEKATKFIGVFIDANLYTHHVANLYSKIALQFS